MSKPTNLAAAATEASPGLSVTDRLGRSLKSLRVSLIDMCNLRCNYCMPEEEYAWLPRDDILTVNEVGRIADAFAELGVDKVRLTGGEPLMRREAVEIVGRLATVPGVRDLSMTTNGVLLSHHADGLRRAGLHRITVSLDTLRPDRFRQLTRRNRLSQVIEGIEAAAAAGFRNLKINTVVMRGYNDDEIVDLIESGRKWRAEVRFIEYMDVGGATRWSLDLVVPRSEILERLSDRYGAAEPLGENGTAPANRYVLPDGTVFGIIASTTDPFCRTCDRGRITADGFWFMCLYAANGLDLRTPLRRGASTEDLREMISNTWGRRADRGAEERKRLNSLRGPLYRIEDLRQDPHREMHTRGG